MWRRCRSCGRVVSPNSAWCPDCGAKLFWSVPLPLIVLVILLILMCVALVVWVLKR
ncbi:MAG TPA: hypothetical protein VGI81_14725 [Tepidisphaeraceae bacterium]|jgi:hypothetical protein